MNKQELIDAVALATGSTKAVTGEAIDAVIGAITKAVVKGCRLWFVQPGHACRANRS